ncbi:MAG: hypothetical protein HKN28_06320, partial [Alphaproteobacteria bacterium]|nr:hypothetical protein [Alphaproteobacteria bacterium]
MRIGFLAAVSFLALVTTAGASEKLTLAVPGGLAGLERQQGVQNGISQAPGTVIAVRQDGKRFEVALTGETLALLPTDSRIVVAPAPDILPDGE